MSFNEIIERLDQWFSKLPTLPTNWKETLVKITPWIAIIFGVLGAVFSLMAVGVLTFLAPLVAVGGGVGVAAGGPIAAVLWLISSVLLIMAYKGTRDRKASGWKLLFWSEVVSLLSSVIFLSISGIFWALVTFYLLFQIRSYYR
jgi:hypothetical protein